VLLSENKYDDDDVALAAGRYHQPKKNRLSRYLYSLSEKYGKAAIFLKFG